MKHIFTVHVLITILKYDGKTHQTVATLQIHQMHSQNEMGPSFSIVIVFAVFLTNSVSFEYVQLFLFCYLEKIYNFPLYFLCQFIMT